MSTLRKQLAAALTEVFPARRYKVEASLGTVDNLGKPLIQLEQAEIEPSPSARGLALVTLRVHVVTHLAGVTPAADDAIDALGVEVFEALARIPWVNPVRGEKAVYKDRHLSYIITTQILTTRSK